MNRDLLKNFLQKNLSSYLMMLRELVGINSFTHNIAGVEKVAETVKNYFAPLGFTEQRIKSSSPNTAAYQFLTRKGSGTKTIALITHHDTVFTEEEETENDFHWREDGDRIYGPGTIDIKGGTIMIFIILSAIKEFAPKLFEDTTWIICCNSCEEILSEGFGKACLELLPSSTSAALVFEAARLRDETDLRILTSRKGRETYRISVEGRSAHAGNAHGDGINAIVELARIISSISSFTDYQREVTVNVGVVSGGTLFNRVPSNATADVEIRSFDPSAFSEFRELLANLASSPTVSSASDGKRSRISAECLSSCVSWPENNKSSQLAEVWQLVGQSLGLQVVTSKSGGLSDGNYLWQKFPTIDALGPVGNGDHCSENNPANGKVQEFIKVSSIVPKALLNTLAIIQILLE